MVRAGNGGRPAAVARVANSGRSGNVAEAGDGRRDHFLVWITEKNLAGVL